MATIQTPRHEESAARLDAIRNKGKMFVLSMDSPYKIHFALVDAINDEEGNDYIDVFDENGNHVGALAHAARATTPDDNVDWDWTVDF